MANPENSVLLHGQIVEESGNWIVSVVSANYIPPENQDESLQIFNNEARVRCQCCYYFMTEKCSGVDEASISQTLQGKIFIRAKAILSNEMKKTSDCLYY